MMTYDLARNGARRRVTSPVDCRQWVISTARGKKSGLRQNSHQNSYLNFTNALIALIGLSQRLVNATR